MAATETAAATATALIRVRRYEIIKLGLDAGEGDGGARRGGRRKEERKGGTGETTALDVRGDGMPDGAGDVSGGGRVAGG